MDLLEMMKEAKRSLQKTQPPWPKGPTGKPIYWCSGQNEMAVLRAHGFEELYDLVIAPPLPSK